MSERIDHVAEATIRIARAGDLTPAAALGIEAQS